MNSRERVIKVLKQEEVDVIPRHLWTLPGVNMFRTEELNEFLRKYPNDIATPEYKYGQGRK